MFKLFIIVSKEKELNKISLKGKYDYYKKILNETINEENIKNVFNTILDNMNQYIQTMKKKINQNQELQKKLQKND